MTLPARLKKLSEEQDPARLSVLSVELPAIVAGLEAAEKARALLERAKYWLSLECDKSSRGLRKEIDALLSSWPEGIQ